MIWDWRIRANPEKQHTSSSPLKAEPLWSQRRFREHSFTISVYCNLSDLVPREMFSGNPEQSGKRLGLLLFLCLVPVEMHLRGERGVTRQRGHTPPALAGVPPGDRRTLCGGESWLVHVPISDGVYMGSVPSGSLFRTRGLFNQLSTHLPICCHPGIVW